MVKDLSKFIHTKNDILGLKTKWPNEIAAYLKNEYSKAFIWAEKAILNKKTDGITDESHKVEKKGDKYVQFEKILNAEADIFKKFGFSESELLGLIKKIELNII